MKLSEAMADAMRRAEFAPRGRLCVSWKRYVKVQTLEALQRRGLIDEHNDLTDSGEAWFNDNVKD